jgi:hypothetical protein
MLVTIQPTTFSFLEAVFPNTKLHSAGALAKVLTVLLKKLKVAQLFEKYTAYMEAS